MASAAQMKKKMAIVCLMLLAVGLMMLIGMADATERRWPPQNCTQTVKDPRVPNNKCICSKNCACAGKCILESPGRVQACFIDCVLKNDCICTPHYPPIYADVNLTNTDSGAEQEAATDSGRPDKESIVAKKVSGAEHEASDSGAEHEASDSGRPDNKEASPSN